MINEILSSAVSGLAASQAGLRSVSNNIANVNVAGYAREKTNLSTQVVGGRVNGVAIGEPSRVADQFLEATVYRRSGDYGRAEVKSEYLDRLQEMLGEPGSEVGLPARLDAIAASAVAMTGAMGTEQTAAEFTANVEDALSSMQRLTDDVDDLRGDVESEVGYTVDRINSLLVRVHDLNTTVSQLTGLGRSTGGPADQRMNALEELSQLVSINVREQPDGRVTVDAANGATLVDRKLRQLSYTGGGGDVSQPSYPPIEIRFADAAGNLGAATGEKLDSSVVGGKLGGLIDLRDRALPDFNEQVGVLFRGMAEAINTVSNANTTVPAPNALEGRQTGLDGIDRMGFTGTAIFAVTGQNGKMVARTDIDFSAMPVSSTIKDVVGWINSGLGGQATASFVDGKLTIAATDSRNGVVVAQDTANPSERAGVGFSHFFGLNDLIRSETSSLVPPGFDISADRHGFAPGQTASFVLRDTNGRELASHTLTMADNAFTDILDDLNSSPLSQFGSFSFDDRGRMTFDPVASAAGASISIPVDSTDRWGTGRTFSSLVGLTGRSSGLSTATVRSDILANALKLPLSRLQPDAVVGEIALGAGDTRGANGFVEGLDQQIDFGKDGTATLQRFSSLLLGKAGLQASQAEDSLADASARRADATNRRDAYSGVNIDEELAQMVVLQNSYAASARVMSTASEMYDTLIAMVG
ncbi:flagellar hook-associated protein FlgK [Stakelama tenebrarum]|nr:flagellar basal body rod C-terminal domain-containing protein [Sphingosinithalassobacter tenebrarum]